MPQEKTNKTNKIAITISWLLVVICMGIIFYFSARPAVQSSEQSAFFVEFLKRLFGENEIFSFIVRKTAHFLEFAGLAVLVFNALHSTFGKFRPFVSFAVTAAYAIIDEIHQHFVDGRACRFFDWLVDCSGAAAALIFIYIIILLSRKIKRRNSYDG